jgi:hypothetical protein
LRCRVWEVGVRSTRCPKPKLRNPKSEIETMEFYKQLKMFAIALCTLASERVEAQLQIKGTFEGGIRYDILQIKPEIDLHGNRLDGFRNLVGGQYGIGLLLGAPTDEGRGFSVKLTAYYLQQDWKYNFSGEGFKQIRTLGLPAGKRLHISGEMTYDLTISRRSLNIPLQINCYLNKHVSLNFGGYVNYALTMTGNGNFSFHGGKGYLLPPDTNGYGKPELGPELSIKPFDATLNYNYLDEYNKSIASSKERINSDTLQGGLMPKEFMAYADAGGRKGLLFKRFDAGLNAGLTIEAGTFFASATINYGLTDLLNNEYHARQSSTLGDDKKTYIFRNEMNRNIGIQLNLGFYLF